MADALFNAGQRSQDGSSKVRQFAEDFLDLAEKGMATTVKEAQGVATGVGYLTDKMETWGKQVEDAARSKLPAWAFSLIFSGKEADDQTKTVGVLTNAIRGMGLEYDAAGNKINTFAQRFDASLGSLGSMKKPAPELDPLSEEKRKALDRSFLELQKSLANESVARAIAREQDLIKMKEFDEKQIGNAVTRQTTRLMIEKKFQEDMRNLRFTSLFQDVATEQEMLEKAYADKLLTIAKFEADRNNLEVNFGELRKKYAQKFAIDSALITARQYSSLASIADTSMGQIRQLSETQGGQTFNILKGLAMATALVHGYAAVVAAIKAGMEIGGPAAPALAASFAAVTAAGVAAQIAAISRTQPNTTGGGAAPAAPSIGAGGGDAAAAGVGGGGGNNQTLYINGINRTDLYSGDAVRDLSRAIIQYQRDGGSVILNG